MKGLKSLPRAEAAFRFKEDPGSIVIPLHQFFKYTGLSEQAFLDELRTGRLVAEHGPPDKKGRVDVFITGTEAVRWEAARIRRQRQH
jgi:hypothetical protein